MLTNTLIFIGICLLVPIFFQISHKVFNQTKLTLILAASFFSALIFSGILLIIYNSGFISLDTSLNQLFQYNQIPLFPIIYFLALNFLSLSVYLLINQILNKNSLQKYSHLLSNILLGLCIAFIFFAYKRPFTLTVFVSFSIILFYIEYKSNLRFMHKAYVAFCIMTLVLILFNILLLNNDDFIKLSIQNSTGLRIIKTPVEMIVLLFCSMLVSINFVERLSNKATN